MTAPADDGMNKHNDNETSGAGSSGVDVKGASGTGLEEQQRRTYSNYNNIADSTTVNGKSGLGNYYLSTAVRMLTDYIKDLRKSNISTDVDVERKIEANEAFLKELKEAAMVREPDSNFLTWQERSILISMLHDYQAVLTRELVLDHHTQPGDPADHYSMSMSQRQLELGMELISVTDDDDNNNDSGASTAAVPLFLSDVDFSEGVYMEPLIAALDLCEKKVHEFTSILPCVIIFNHLCDYLVHTLSSIAEKKFERYRHILDQLLHKQDVLEGVQIPSSLRNSVSFCFELLVGLARRFQLVADLLRKCSSPEWYKSALELADVRPAKARRWSEFSLAIRNCEWSMDLAELAFHALEKLLIHGTYTVKDASFKWSEAKCRMVLQIPGKIERQNNSVETSLLEVSRELEEKDLAALIDKLEKLAKSEKEKKGFFTLGKLSNAHGIAQFLSAKLRGPIPEIGTYLPFSWNLESSSLRYLEYLDKGSSGMVAVNDWYGMKVAVKSVRGLGLSRSKFEQESAILAMVQHPNVVRLIGCGFLETSRSGAGGTGQLVMELMDHDLRTIIDSRLAVLPKGCSPFSPIVAIDLMLQIAQAMRYLREHGVLHRGLKAKNILVNICKPLTTSDSRGVESDSANTMLMGQPVSAVLPHTQENYVAKLADFGLAKCRPQSSYVTTLMAGTTGWRAPEVFHVPDMEVAHDYKWPADVYSFAMTCFEIVTGKLPFEGEPNHSLHGKIMDGVRPVFNNLRAEFPDAVKELIQQCWATSPADRPSFNYIVQKLWECKVLAILPGFERKIMQTSGVSRLNSRR